MYKLITRNFREKRWGQTSIPFCIGCRSVLIERGSDFVFISNLRLNFHYLAEMEEWLALFDVTWKCKVAFTSVKLKTSPTTVIRWSTRVEIWIFQNHWLDSDHFITDKRRVDNAGITLMFFLCPFLYNFGFFFRNEYVNIQIKKKRETNLMLPIPMIDHT